MRRIRTAVVDVSDDVPDLDLEAADEWRILVTLDGAPVDHVVLASPGRTGPRALELALRRAAERVVALEASGELLPPPETASDPVTISVVVPTHRRPEALRDLLASVARLDPAPAEIVVVDNDPGGLDCRAVAEAAGVRYMREDRRGLNVARRAGLRAATGDVIAFTDDDCVVTERWLATLPAWFADPLVGVVAGPGFAHELETGAQLRREEEAGFDKGMRRRRFDWRATAPAQSGIVGSGNSMAIRRDLAERLEVFPPELDAGTPAPAAGDLYAIYRILAAGYDAVYEPRMAFFHRHPRGDLRTTIRNYGHGVGAYYTKLLVENRELVAVRLWHWFVRLWLEAVLDALAGERDRGRVRVRWAYLAASAGGPQAWRRSLAALDDQGRADLARARATLGTERLDEIAKRRGLQVDAAGPRRLALQLVEAARCRRAWWRLAGGGALRGASAPAASPSHAGMSVAGAAPISVAPVAAPDTDPRAFWTAAAAAVAHSTAEAVAIPLPGVDGDGRWLSEVGAALEGSRVAVAIGAGAVAGAPPEPLALFARPQRPGHYQPIGPPPQYLGVRRDLYDRLGGFDLTSASLGWHAPLLDYTERALDAGLTVAHLDSHGLHPPGCEAPVRSRNAWLRARARAALLTRDARLVGGMRGIGLVVWAGLVPILRFRRPSAVAPRRIHDAIGSLAAFAVGCVSGLRHGGAGR